MGALISAPIAAVGSCLGSCLGAAACTACCKACSCRCTTPPRVTNTLYVALMVAGAATAMILRVSGLTLSFGANVGINGATTCFNATGTCDSGDSRWGTQTLSWSLCSGSHCKGNWAVYQVSFAFMCFFSAMTLLTCTQTKFSSYAQHGHWFAKIVCILLLLVATAFMEADSLASYSMVARYVAPFFMLYQLIMFIDFGYRLNSYLLDRDEAERSLLCVANNSGALHQKWMLATTILIYLAIIAGIGWMYSAFNPDGGKVQVLVDNEPVETDAAGCSFNIAIVTVTLLFVLLNTGIGLVRKVAPHASVLTSAIVTGYCTILCYGALGSMHYEDPRQAHCNPQADSSNTGQVVLNIFLACGALSLTGWGAGNREQKHGGSGDVVGKAPGGMTAGVSEQVSAAGVAPSEGGIANDAVTVDVNADQNELSRASFWRYHLVMTLCSVYMAMLLTNWGDSEDAEPTRRYNLGVASAWVQVAANWTCSALYLWTLVIPYLCRNHRDFGVDFDL